jgi:hypothetical protein
MQLTTFLDHVKLSTNIVISCRDSLIVLSQDTEKNL